MEDNQAAEEKVGGDVIRKMASTNKTIVVDDFNIATPILRVLGTEERQRVEHKERIKIEGHTHPLPCYITTFTCESSLPKDTHEEPKPKKARIAGDLQPTQEPINRSHTMEPNAEEEEASTGGNDSIVILEAAEVSEAVEGNEAAEVNGAAEGAGAEEARAEEVEVIQLAEIPEETAEDAAEAVQASQVAQTSPSWLSVTTPTRWT